ncbi:hypothetical protein SAMN05421504_11650 [Amycolatopsis xylanica]|uniref:Uncharacterized protein n=1 Tax=Amycolatopsis xylanica TaxID=589385 RepID=A0A1H3SXT4_9PSEU|nr:hypothetical protein [Amycolatopsis xylanica]SDZ42744.1 hypothetical protein SAMN05421504_11650 [Amycolatopsis xylanica]
MTTTSTQRWLIPALIVVVSLTVGGGLLARELYSPPAAAPIVPGTLPTSVSLAPEDQPGSDEVFLTADAAAHPDGEGVRGALQIYFRSINQKNYDLWASVASAKRLSSKPRDQWLDDYKSTKDGSVLIYRIEAPVGSLRVLVGFTSTQAVESAPGDLMEPCIRWRVVLPMVNENGAWKIDPADGSTPEKEKC